jgi:hypothetical protein
VGALLALAQLSALVHLIVVPHGFCAMHAELVHERGHAAPPHAGHEGRATGGAEIATAVKPAGGDGHGDHCPLSILLRRPQPGVCPRAEASWAVAATSAPEGLGDDAERRESVPLLLRAPKNSPPGRG